MTYRSDPVSVALYAKQKGLLQVSGFRRANGVIKGDKVLARMANRAVLRVNRSTPKYKYRYQVPGHHREAVWMDEKAGTTQWAKSEALELQQLMDYDSFKDLGKDAPIPEGHTVIPCHMVYDVKWDGRFKSRFCAGGHRTSAPTEDVYSGVVSIQGV